MGFLRNIKNYLKQKKASKTERVIKDSSSSYNGLLSKISYKIREYESRYKSQCAPDENDDLDTAVMKALGRIYEAKEIDSNIKDIIRSEITCSNKDKSADCVKLEVLSPGICYNTRGDYPPYRNRESVCNPCLALTKKYHCVNECKFGNCIRTLGIDYSPPMLIITCSNPEFSNDLPTVRDFFIEKFGHSDDQVDAWDSRYKRVVRVVYYPLDCCHTVMFGKPKFCHSFTVEKEQQKQ